MCPLDRQGRRWVYGSIQHHRKNCRNSIKTCKITYIICLCCIWWRLKSVNVKKLGNQTPWHSTMTMCCFCRLPLEWEAEKTIPNSILKMKAQKTTATNTQPMAVIVLSKTTTARRETITTTHKYYILALNLPIPGLLDSRVWKREKQ